MKSTIKAKLILKPSLSLALALAAALMVTMALAVPAAAFELPELSGSARYQLHYGFESGTIDWDVFELRLSLDGDLGEYMGYHADIGADITSQPEGSIKFVLGELYADASVGPVDLRAGNLIVSWGVADGINPMNVVNPIRAIDAGALVTAGVDSGASMRKPVPAIEATYYARDGVTAVTGVLILDYVPTTIPPLFGPVEPPATQGLFDEVEVAVRAETMLGAYNVYASYFRGRQDLPAAWLEGFTPRLEYRRMHHVGLAAAGSIGGAAVWAEASVSIPDSIPQLEPGAPGIIPMSSNDVNVQAVAGAEYTFDIGRGLFASVQAVYDSSSSLYVPYVQPGAEAPGAGVYGIAALRYPLADDRLVQLVAVADVMNKAVLLMPSYTFTVLPAVELSLSAVTAIGQDLGGAAGITSGIKASF